MDARGPKNGRQGLERGLPLVFWALRLHKFFDPSTLSVRKGNSGEEKKRRKEKTDENSGNYVIASSRPLE